jgi:hypothetical protein
MRRVALAIPAALAAACSLALDGFSGGTDAPDASPDADAATSVAQPDALPDAPSGGWIACRDRAPSASLLFCDDFDDPGETVGAKWTRGASGTITPSTLALSPPSALRAGVPTLTTQYAFSNLSTVIAIPQAASSVTLRFAVDLETFGGTKGGYLSLAGIHFTDSACPTQGTGKQRRIELTFSDTGALFLFAVGLQRECSTTGDDTFAALSQTQLPATGFAQVELRASSAACPGKQGSSITLLVGGDAVACAATGIDPMAKRDGAYVVLGISSGMPWNATTLDYDDVEVVVP